MISLVGLFVSAGHEFRARITEGVTRRTSPDIGAGSIQMLFSNWLVPLPIIFSARKFKTLRKTHRKVLNTSNLAQTKLLLQGRIYKKNMAFLSAYVAVLCSQGNILDNRPFSLGGQMLSLRKIKTFVFARLASH